MGEQWDEFKLLVGNGEDVWEFGSYDTETGATDVANILRLLTVGNPARIVCALETWHHTIHDYDNPRLDCSRVLWES